MAIIDIRHDFGKFAATLDDFGRARMPKEAVVALNGTSFIARSAVVKEIGRVFDRPNRWTLGGVLVDKASVGRLETAVGLRDRVDIRKSRGLPASVYLRPQIDGGARGQKSHEKALSEAGVIPPGYYLVPTRHADMDAHGNMTVGQIIKILSSLNAFKEVGATQNAWGRKGRGVRKGESYFVIVPGRPQGRGGRGGGLPAGIYKTVASGFGRIVVPVAALVGKPPSYTPRLDFDGVTNATIEWALPRLMGEAMERALAAAGPQGRL
ncbi:hypothetical protein ACVFYP_22325 [Roseomonas sp. F4]